MATEDKVTQAIAPESTPTPVTPVPEPTTTTTSATSAVGAASPSSPSRRRRGRRPAGADTRSQILASARQLFSERGYDAVSLRAIARGADVDPALVHHYFEGKPAVFTASMLTLKTHPAHGLATIAQTPHDEVGAAVVRVFLGLWEDPEARAGMRGLLDLALTTEEGLRPLREFLVTEILGKLPASGDDGVLDPRRAQLMSSQLLGLAMARYALCLPAMANATADELVAWAGPTLQRYYEEPLEAMD